MQTKNPFLLTLALIILTFTACDKEDRCVSGSGATVNKTVTLGAFSGVDLQLPGNVEIVKSNTFKIELQAKENIIDLIRTDIVGSHLRIDTENRCIKGHTDMHFKVHTSELGYLRVAGSGSINSPDEFPLRDWVLKIEGSGAIHARMHTSKAEAIISGSGNMHIRGISSQFQARISGSGTIAAFDMITQALNAGISGSGNIEATVSEKLIARISGSGHVHYRGQPSITHINVSGSGKVIKVN